MHAANLSVSAEVWKPKVPMSSMGASSASTVATKRPDSRMAAVVAFSLLSDTDNVAGSLATCTSVFTTQPQRRSPALAVMR